MGRAQRLALVKVTLEPSAYRRHVAPEMFEKIGIRPKDKVCREAECAGLGFASFL
jgi:hypothetical protein